MMKLKNLFNKPPDIDQLKASKDVQGLIKAFYYYAKDVTVSQRAALALSELGPGTIDALLVPLADQDVNVATLAWNSIMAMGRAATDELIRCYETGVSSGNAARILAAMADPRATEALMSCLYSLHDIQLRQLAAQALGQIGSDQAIEALMRRLRSEDNSQAHQTLVQVLSQHKQAKVLLEVETHPAVLKLKQLKTYASPQTVFNAESALRGIDELPTNVLREVLTYSGRHAAFYEILGAYFQKLGEQGIQTLVDMLNAENVTGCMNAAMILEQIGWTPGTPEDAATYWLARSEVEEVMKQGEAAIPVLLEALDKPGYAHAHNQLMLMLEELGWQPQESSENSLHYYVMHEAWEKCAAYGEAAVQPLVDNLERLKKDGGYNVIPIISALGKIGSDRAIEAIVDFYHLRTKHLRDARALEQIVDVRILEPLYDCASSAAALVRERPEAEKRYAAIPSEQIKTYCETATTATAGLAKVGAQLKTRAERLAAVRLLAKLLEETGCGINSDAAAGLGSFHEPRAYQLLVEYIDKNKDPVAAWALGRSGNRQAVGVLKRFANSPNPDMRKAVKAALAQLEPESE